MTSQNKHRIAALLALAIGLMAIVEVGSVLLGIETRTYHVLSWLVRYNVVLGFISVCAGIRLWRKENLGVMMARIILVCHGVVFPFRSGACISSERPWHLLASWRCCSEQGYGS